MQNPNQLTVRQIMFWVIIACLPGISLQWFLFGWPVITTLLIACSSAWVCELFILQIRKKPLKPFLTDASILVSGLLFSFCLPPTLPWWMIILGSVSMVVLGKHLYGGLGHNIFNPAMVGYIILLIAYPAAMVQWPIESVHVDGYTGATPLNNWQTLHLQDIKDSAQLLQPNSLLYWQWVNLAWLAGGLLLLWKRIISWHIPVSLLLAMTIISGLSWIYNPSLIPSPLFQLLTGASMLGAFFIATDPVTAPASYLGKIVFGASVGIITIVIRLWGGYPDGVAFAVLLMNMTAPLIDKYLIPKAYGR